MGETSPAAGMRKKKKLSPAQKQQRALAAAITCASASGLAFGITLTLVRTKLFELGLSDFQLGLFSAFIGAMGFGTAFLIPTLARKMGTRTYLLFACFVQIIAFALMLFASNILHWILLDSIRAFSALLIFGLSEAWVTELAPPKIRARIMSVYASFWAGSMAVGSAIPPLFGYDNGAAQLAGMLTAGLAFAAVAYAPQAPTPPSKNESSPAAMLRRFKILPLAFLCIIANGAYETTSLAFFHIYGEQIGLPRATAGGLVVSVSFGMVFLLPLLGLLTDRLGWQRALQVCILLTIGAPILVLFSGGNLTLAYFGAFVAGGAALAFYVIGLVQIGETFKVEQLASANALVMICYTTGASFGPLSAGGLSEIVGPAGLMVGLVGFSAFFALGWTILYLTRGRN